MSNAEAQSRGVQPSPLQNAPSIWQQSHLLIIAVGVLLMCGTAIVVTFSVLRKVEAVRSDTEAVKARLNGEPGSLPAANSADSQNASGSGWASGDTALEQKQPVSEAALVARQRLLKFKSQLDMATEQLAELRTARDLAKVVQADLLTSEQGRRIASDPEAVRSFMTLLDMERPNLAATVALQDRVYEIREPVEIALRNKGNELLFQPGEELAAAVDLLLLDVRTITASTVMQHRLTQDLVAKFANAAPSSKTLGEVVQEIRIEAADAQLAELNAVRKAAQDEANALMIAAEKDAIAARGKAEAEARRILGETEAAAIIEEAKLRKEKLDDDLTRRKEEQRIAELRKRAADPLVQRKYSAFLDKGKLEFVGGPSEVGRMTERGQPVSWSSLTQHGWMKTPEMFAKAMSAQPFYIMKNDRRVAPLPQTEAEWKETERLLEDFKQLGPIWVEMELLLP